MKVFIFSLALIFCFPVFAERTTKNGGGLAEMKAIHAHQNMTTYLKACFSTQVCNLSATEEAELRQLETLSKQVEIVPDPKLDALTIFENEAQLIRLSSASLYENSLPKPSMQIASIVLAAQWSRISKNFSRKEIIDRSQKIFEAFKERVQSYESESFAVTLHQFEFELRDQSFLVLFLEDSKKTLDITKLIELPACRAASVHLENWRETRAYSERNTLILLADASANCDSQFRGVLILEVGLEDQLLKPESLKSAYRRTY